jgi:hypothetical protein
MKSVFILLTFILSYEIQAQIAQFSFTNSIGDELTFAADSQPANGTVSSISRGAGLTPNISADRFSSRAWSLNGLDVNDYYTFSITPQTGFQTTLTGLSLDEGRSGTGPTNWAVYSSLDNFNAALSSFNIAPSDTSMRLNQTILLNGSFENLDSSVEFRFYAWDATSGSGTWRIDNVKLFGSIDPVTSVPEPSALALMSMGLFMVCFVKKGKLRGVLKKGNTGN